MPRHFTSPRSIRPRSTSRTLSTHQYTARRAETQPRSLCSPRRLAPRRCAVGGRRPIRGCATTFPLLSSFPLLRHAPPPPHAHKLHHFVHRNATRSRRRRSGPVEDTELAADEPRCPATYNSAHELPRPSATDSSRRRRPRAPLGEEFHAHRRRPHGGAAGLASSPMRASSTVGS